MVTLFSSGPVYKHIIYFFSNVTRYHSIRTSLTSFYRSERQPGVERSDPLWGHSDPSLKTNNLMLTGILSEILNIRCRRISAPFSTLRRHTLFLNAHRLGRESYIFALK